IWTFDNISGTTVYDDSGNDNNGTISGATVVDGVVDKALSFDGNNDYVAIGNDSAFENIEGITVSAWVYLDTVGVTGAAIVSKYWDGSDRSWYLYLIPAGFRFLCSTDSQNDNDAAYDSTAVLPGEWYHVAGMWNPADGVIRIYVNGRVGSNQANQPGSTVRANNAPVWIGRDYYNNSPRVPLDGKIDDVRVFREAFTQAQVQQLYAEGLESHRDLALIRQ
ncbi:MAG: LamG domain-containing protein, partial [Candidatus Pacebacteria bacterium]|nr:LamG domain-containing protein [Candidatus Paceibacterota bacterium]